MKTQRTLLLCLLLTLLLVLFTGCEFEIPGLGAKPTGIRVDTQDVKTNYVTGDTFSTDGLKVFVTYSDGSEQEISLDGVTVGEVDTSKVGIYTVNVTYDEMKTTFMVYVEEKIVVSKLTLTVGQNAKTEYITGDAFDPTGLLLVAEWTDGKKETLTPADVMSGFDTETVGEKTVTFTYEGKTQSYDINVKVPFAETDIVLNTKSVKTQYKQHETFTTNNLVVTVNDTWGGSRVLAATEYTVTGGDTETAGQKTVNVSYGTFTKTFTINVSAAAIESFTVNLTKVTVDQGTAPNLSGLVVTLKKELETARALNASEYTVSSLTALKLGNNTITVTLNENTAYTATFTVLVRKVSSISVNTTGVKLDYEQHEAVDFTGLAVTAVRSDGTSFDVGNNFTLTGYDTSLFGTQTVTVTYVDTTFGTFTTTFTINVAKASIQGITVDTTGVTLVYNKGETVDLSGIVVKVKKKNEQDTTLTLNAETNGYTLTHDTFGDSKNYTVTVTLKEDTDFTATFTVTIREVTEITLDTTSVKKTYKQHESFSSTGLTVTAVRSDGTEFDVTANVTLSGNDTDTAGTKTVTVTYNESFTATFSVTVNEALIETFTVDDSAVTKYFENGSTIDYTTGLVVKLKKELENEQTLTSDKYTVSVDKTVNGVGKYTVTVTLNEKAGYTDTFEIGVYEVAGITLNTADVKKAYKVKELISLDNLLVSLNRGQYAPALSVAIADCTVDLSAVDTTFPGTYPITVSYNGYSASYNVVYTMDAIDMTSFGLPAFATDFESNSKVSSETDAGYLSSITYRVGDDNGFVFKPIVKAENAGGIYTPTTFETAFELWESGTQLTGDTLAAIVSYTPKTYTFDFTEAAVGHSYTLKVQALNTTETIPAISFSFTVVDGWNVYTAADLSRMANSNWTVSVNASGSTVNEKTIWDAYKLSHGVTKIVDSQTVVDETPVCGIVLQNSLNLTNADLPAEYFVTAAEDPTGLAVGHLKDWTYAYHHILADGENFCMYGNGFSVNISAIDSVYDDAGHTWGYGSDYSNCNIFKFEGNNPMDNKAGIGTNSVLVQDITITGNAMRTNNMEQLVPDLGGMIGLKFTNCNATLNNAIITRSFIGIISDFNNKMTINTTKIYDSLQDAMFVWGGSVIHINDSIMTRAGGPLIIMQHYDPTLEGFEERIPELYIDDNSTLNNYVNGQEAWFQNNGATSSVQAIIGLDGALAQAAGAYNGALETYSLPTFTRKSILTAESAIKQGGNSETYYLNLVNIMMSDAVSVGTAGSGAQGTTSVNGVTVASSLSNSKATTLRAMLATAIGAENAAQVVILENSNGQLMWTDGTNLYAVTETNPAVSMTDFVTAELTAYQTSGGTDPIDTSFFTSGDYLTIHMGGMAIVLKYN